MEYNSVNINAPDSTTIKQQPDAFKNKEKKDSRQARLEAFRRSYAKKVKKASKMTVPSPVVGFSEEPRSIESGGIIRLKRRNVNSA